MRGNFCRSSANETKGFKMSPVWNYQRLTVALCIVLLGVTAMVCAWILNHK
jgi:hypothetical protein